MDWFSLVRKIQASKVGYTKLKTEIQLTPENVVFADFETNFEDPNELQT